MNNDSLEQMLNIFVEALEKGDILKDPSMNYRRICDTLALDAAALDGLLRKDFGRSGAEIVDSWRGNVKLIG